MQKVSIVAKKRPLHLIEQSEEILRNRGILVLDNVTDMPAYDEPIVSPHVVVALNLCGCVKAEYDTQPVVFNSHDVSVVLPNHILNAQEVSPDYHAMLIVISESHFERMKQQHPIGYQENLFYHWQAHFHLTDSQFTDIHALFRLLYSLNQADNERRKEMTDDLIKVLFMLLQEYRELNGQPSNTPSQQMQLFTRFYDAITEHYTESREVRFYAELFNLSPKHFATVVKEQTGVSALKWINSYVIIQAKALLRNQRHLTIQQVALQLGFPEQSSFSRFFKHHEKLSPTAYRERV